LKDTTSRAPEDVEQLQALGHQSYGFRERLQDGLVMPGLAG
jgi:hypothetical protein